MSLNILRGVICQLARLCLLATQLNTSGERPPGLYGHSLTMIDTYRALCVQTVSKSIMMYIILFGGKLGCLGGKLPPCPP